MIRRSVEDSFLPEFDEDGNQLYIQTKTGDWALNYNAANRPTDFSCMDEEGNFLTVKCDYDFMGRRVFKKVISGNSTVISHQRFIYRGYLQIACVDLTRTNHPCLWLIIWDPTQPVATRPLAIQKDGTWYTYGLDLTKNVCEVFGATGYIRTAYTYSPFGQVTATGNVTQPIQWSSEFHDEEMGLVYYNWRYFDSLSGKWIERDELWEKVSQNLYSFCNNFPCNKCDVLGLSTIWEKGDVREIVKKSYNLDFPIVKEIHLEDHKILSLSGLRLNKTLTSYFYFIVMGSSAIADWNRHALFMHRHYLAGTGKDYTYMPEDISSLKYLLKEGYDFGRKHNFKGPIRMKKWRFVSDITNEAYTLKDYEYIVGGDFDEQCYFCYSVYIKDKYDFNYREDRERSYITYDNFARLMGGVVPGVISEAKPFIVKGKKEDVYRPVSRR